MFATTAAEAGHDQAVLAGLALMFVIYFATFKKSTKKGRR